MVERARQDGANQVEIEQTAATANTLKNLYDHPVSNAALAFATTFPVGLVFSLVAALVLRTKGASRT